MVTLRSDLSVVGLQHRLVMRYHHPLGSGICDAHRTMSDGS